MSQSDQCLMCRHYRGLHTYDAYPDDIPQEIFTGMHDHVHPFLGDLGIRFEADDNLKEESLPYA